MTKKHRNLFWRRFSRLGKLPPPKRKQIMQILDAFLNCKDEEKQACSSQVQLYVDMSAPR